MSRDKKKMHYSPADASSSGRRQRRNSTFTLPSSDQPFQVLSDRINNHRGASDADVRIANNGTQKMIVRGRGQRRDKDRIKKLEEIHAAVFGEAHVHAHIIDDGSHSPEKDFRLVIPFVAGKNAEERMRPAIDALMRERAMGRSNSVRAKALKLFLIQNFLLMLKALKKVHAHKLVHLDVRPPNVIIALDFSEASLIDFDNARFSGEHFDQADPAYRQQSAHNASEIFGWGEVAAAASQDVYSLSFFYSVYNGYGMPLRNLLGEVAELDRGVEGDPAARPSLDSMINAVERKAIQLRNKLYSDPPNRAADDESFTQALCILVANGLDTPPANIHAIATRATLAANIVRYPDCAAAILINEAEGVLQAQGLAMPNSTTQQLRENIIKHPDFAPLFLRDERYQRENFMASVRHRNVFPLMAQAGLITQAGRDKKHFHADSLRFFLALSVLELKRIERLHALGMLSKRTYTRVLNGNWEAYKKQYGFEHSDDQRVFDFIKAHGVLEAQDLVSDENLNRIKNALISDNVIRYPNLAALILTLNVDFDLALSGAHIKTLLKIQNTILRGDLGQFDLRQFARLNDDQLKAIKKTYKANLLDDWSYQQILEGKNPRPDSEYRPNENTTFAYRRAAKVRAEWLAGRKAYGEKAPRLFVKKKRLTDGKLEWKCALEPQVSQTNTLQAKLATAESSHEPGARNAVFFDAFWKASTEIARLHRAGIVLNGFDPNSVVITDSDAKIIRFKEAALTGKTPSRDLDAFHGDVKAFCEAITDASVGLLISYYLKRSCIADALTCAPEDAPCMVDVIKTLEAIMCLTLDSVPEQYKEVSQLSDVQRQALHLLKAKNIADSSVFDLGEFLKNEHVAHWVVQIHDAGCRLDKSLYQLFFTHKEKLEHLFANRPDKPRVKLSSQDLDEPKFLLAWLILERHSLVSPEIVLKLREAPYHFRDNLIQYPDLAGLIFDEFQDKPIVLTREEKEFLDTSANLDVIRALGLRLNRASFDEVVQGGRQTGSYERSSIRPRRGSLVLRDGQQFTPSSQSLVDSPSMPEVRPLFRLEPNGQYVETRRFVKGKRDRYVRGEDGEVSIKPSFNPMSQVQRAYKAWKTLYPDHPVHLNVVGQTVEQGERRWDFRLEIPRFEGVTLFEKLSVSLRSYHLAKEKGDELKCLRLEHSMMHWLELALKEIERAHMVGIIHGDIRLENVIIGRDADGIHRAYLIDFMDSAQNNEKMPCFNPSLLHAKPAHYAPERASDVPGDTYTMTPGIDAYAFCSLFEFRKVTSAEESPNAEESCLLLIQAQETGLSGKSTLSRMARDPIFKFGTHETSSTRASLPQIQSVVKKHKKQVNAKLRAMRVFNAVEKKMKAEQTRLEARREDTIRIFKDDPTPWINQIQAMREALEENRDALLATINDSEEGADLNAEIRSFITSVRKLLDDDEHGHGLLNNNAFKNHRSAISRKAVQYGLFQPKPEHVAATEKALAALDAQERNLPAAR